jgi:signal transduction histidine kinase
VVGSGTDAAVEERLRDRLALASDLHLDGVLERVLPMACAHADAGAAALWVLDETGDVAEVRSHGLSRAAAQELLVRLAGTARPDRLDDPVHGPLVATPIGGDHSPTAAGLLVVAEPAGGEFPDDAVVAVSHLAQVLDVVVRNARTFSHSERRRQLVAACGRISESLHPPYRLVEPVNRIVAGAAELLRSSLVAVVRSGEHGYDVAAAVSPHAGALPELLEALAPGIRQAQETGLLVEAAYGDRGTAAAAPLNPELAFEGVVLVVLDRGRGTLIAEDRELLTTFVTHSSLVLDRAVLLRERQEAVVAADRDRIARDLHDTVVQRLYATGLKLQATRHQSVGPDDARLRVAEAVSDLDLTIRDIRSTIFELEHGPDASLRAGVAGLVREYQPLLGFLPVVRTWGPLNSLVGRPLAAQVLTVLREALSNCLRHAAATTCLVEIELGEQWLTLRVTDDGRGLPPDPPESGLRNLRSRAEELGGYVELRRADPRGTRLEWCVPVADG